MYKKRSKTAEILVFFVFFPRLVSPHPTHPRITTNCRTNSIPSSTPRGPLSQRREKGKGKCSSRLCPPIKSKRRPTHRPGGREGRRQLRIQTQPVEMGVVGGGGVLEKRVVEIEEEEEEDEFKWRRRVPSPFLFPSAEEVMLSS